MAGNSSNIIRPEDNQQGIPTMNHVYRLRNTLNGKSYIGITGRDVLDRWDEHLSRARCGQRNSRLYDALRKYGADKFEVTTLKSTDCEDTVRELEKKYIQEFDSYENGYNCNLGGHGFLEFPEEIRKKISEAQKGKIISQAAREKMSKAKRGDSRCAKHFGEHTNKGADNPRAKYYLVERPDGVIEIGKGLRAFCRENKLLHSKLSSKKHTKGFKLLGTFNVYPEKEYAQARGSAIHPQT